MGVKQWCSLFPIHTFQCVIEEEILEIGQTMDGASNIEGEIILLIQFANDLAITLFPFFTILQ